MIKELISQYKSPKKIGFIIGFVGFIASLITIYSFMFPNTDEIVDKLAKKTAERILKEITKEPPDNLKKTIEEIPQFSRHFNTVNELLNKERNRIPKRKEISEEIVRFIKMKAENGDIQAQLSLAGMYFLGLGIPQNDIEATKWYGKVAKQENIEAELTLGWMDIAAKTSSKTDPPNKYKAYAVYIEAINGSPYSFKLKRNGKKLPVIAFQRLQDGDKIFILHARNHLGVENTITLALDNGEFFTLRHVDTPYLVRSSNIHPTLGKNIFYKTVTWYSSLWNTKVNQADMATK
jgi:hypothetical protein